MGSGKRSGELITAFYEGLGPLLTMSSHFSHLFVFEYAYKDFSFSLCHVRKNVGPLEYTVGQWWLW